MDFTVESLHTVEKDMNLEIAKILKAVNVSSTVDLNENVLLKLNKNPLASTVLRLVHLVEMNMNICKSAAGKIDRLKSEQITNQKRLLEIQDGKLGSVQETVKTELKSWADVVKNNNNQLQKSQLTKKTVQEAVKSVNEEEKRSRNFLIFGYPEMYSSEAGKEDVELYTAVQSVDVVTATAGLPNTGVVDAYRLGKRSSEKGRPPRPIKVECTSADEVQLLLKNAYKLKSSDHGWCESAYVVPDRTKEERNAHNKLVAEMRQMILEDSSKYYYIRGNKINSVDKKLSAK